MTKLTALTDARFNLDRAKDLAQLVKAAAEPNRLYILSLLHEWAELTVTEVTANLPLSEPTVSHHLKRLLAAGLVSRRREASATAWGRTHYALVPERLAQLSDLIHPAGAR